MTWLIGGLIALACLLQTSSTAPSSDDKIMPFNIGFNPGGFQPQPQPVYQQPYQQPYEQAGFEEEVVEVDEVEDEPDNAADGPPNYGNAPGPSENAIAPNVNPYPRHSHCIVSGERNKSLYLL